MTSQTIDTPRETRRTVASYPDYAAAERAVDWLSDQGFAVERVAIVGRGLRSVDREQAEKRGITVTEFAPDRSLAARVDEAVAGGADALLARGRRAIRPDGMDWVEPRERDAQDFWRAMTVMPGEPGAAAVDEVADPARETGGELVRGLLVGGCGTDREIAESAYGEVPSGQATGQPSTQGPRREDSGSSH